MQGEIEQERAHILIAIALQYKATEGIPKVIAKGYGDIAMKMVEFAKNNNIEVKTEAELAMMLSVLDIDDFIPYEAFKTVAQIIQRILNK